MLLQTQKKTHNQTSRNISWAYPYVVNKKKIKRKARRVSPRSRKHDFRTVAAPVATPQEAPHVLLLIHLVQESKPTPPTARPAIKRSDEGRGRARLAVESNERSEEQCVYCEASFPLPERTPQRRCSSSSSCFSYFSISLFHPRLPLRVSVFFPVRRSFLYHPGISFHFLFS